MSTIASPRPSLSSASRRTSASTDTTITSTTKATSVPERGSLRRNRAALRDYYNLAAASQSPPPPQSLDLEKDSELDKPGFEPETYVTHLLATEGLEGVLKVEGTLVSDIRSLDGEKKALVYDNYSKLIAATETIRRMKEKMDPLTPTTSTLTPAIAHIAEQARDLRAQMQKASRNHNVSGGGRTREQQETVRWVIGAPERIKELTENGDLIAAEKEWDEVNELLEEWGNVKGVQEVRSRCQAALGKDG